MATPPAYFYYRGPRATKRTGVLVSPEQANAYENLIPGLAVMSGNAKIKNLQGPEAGKIVVPLHGLELAKQVFGDDAWEYAFGSNPYTARPDNVLTWPTSRETHKAKLTEIGRQYIEDTIQAGFLLPQARESTPYQYFAAAWLCAFPYYLAVWAGGAGKTRGVGQAAMVRIFKEQRTHGGLLILGPDISTGAWLSDLPRVANVEVFHMKAQSHRRKKDKTLDKYLAGCSVPVIFMAQESTPILMHELFDQHSSFAGLGIDEIDVFGSAKRVSARAAQDGRTAFSAATTTQGNLTQAAAVSWCSKLPTLTFRAGATATPINSGKLRRAYAQWDLLDPLGLGSKTSFRARYTAAKENAYTEWDDSENANVEEFGRRFKWLAHEVSRDESHKELPPNRIEVQWLDLDQKEINAGRVGQRELKAMLKGKQKEDDFGEVDIRAYMHEVRLASAAESKKKRIFEYIKTVLEENPAARIVMFLNRRHQTEMWARDLTKKLDAPVRHAHGEHSREHRQECIDWLMAPEVWGPNGPDDGDVAPFEGGVLLTTVQSMGRSLNGMQNATHLIFAVLPSQPGTVQQNLARVDRLGKKISTLVTVFVGRGTYDEQVVSAFKCSTDTVKRVVVANELDGLYRALKNEYSQEQMSEMFRASVMGADNWLGDDDD